MNERERARVLEHIVERAVPASIDLWPSLSARAKTRRARAVSLWLTRGGVAAALVAAFVGCAVALEAWGRPPDANAETILERAQSVGGSPTSISSYHLVMTRQSAINHGSGSASTSEVWFDGPERQRTTQRSGGPSVGVGATQDVIFNGAETWIVISENATTTRAIHTFGTTWTRPADVPSVTGSLADLLNSFGSKQCLSARLQGDGSVASQATFIVGVTPNPVGCLLAWSAPNDASARGPVAHVSGAVQGLHLDDVGETRVWVDKSSFLPLKTEVRDPSGALLERSEVTSVQYNVSIPPSTFSYSPPAGVAISTFTGGDGADVKRALYSGPPQSATKAP